MSKPSSEQTALHRAAIVIQRLEKRLESAERARSEPIAIIGAGCRLPGGVDDLASLWRLLERGADAVTPIPASRFNVDDFYDPDPAAKGKTYARNGAFLGSIDSFDADFFGISPREAAWIDPQHRLVLECAREALERAGMAGETHGSQTGVYLGIGPSDYGQGVLRLASEQLEGYLATGTGPSFSAGRLSFLLGLRGPAVAVDTACSSSLVAVHLACNALRAGQCEAALAGGVQVMLSPEPFILLSRLRALAPDGRCKSFSNRADGYGRGEGCGVLVLKRLSDAQRDGDPIVALIRGTAINHDGASSGLTTPNGSAQAAVIRQALLDARLAAEDIDYVEAHGTGTALGDPIEAEALAESYGATLTRPLAIGSLKSNIGHLESAAGVSGILKVIASLQHEALPASLHAEELSTHIDWNALPIRLVTKLEDWRRGARTRVAGVSSFGMSGTNAHVILQEAPESGGAKGRERRRVEPYVLSAKSEGALNDAVRRLRERLEGNAELSLGDVAYTLATTRSELPERLCLSAGSRAELLEKLRAAETGGTPSGGTRGRAIERRGKLCWLFTGQGAQRVGMGRELYAEWEVFREALDEVSALLDAQLALPLKEVMWGEPGELLNQTGYTQPALFALEWALSQLLKSWGIRPDVVAGHSVGEITAACEAGVFTLNEAAKLVNARGRLMQELPAGGAMVSIAAREEEVQEQLEQYRRTVSLAAHNGPRSVVIAGEERDVMTIAEGFSRRGVSAKRLLVSHAFHSPLMDPMLEEFRRVAERVEYREPRLMLVSNASGEVAGREVMRAEYWVKHAREAVRFREGVETLRREGVTQYMEIGPRSTLSSLVGMTVAEAEAKLVPVLRTGAAEATEVLDALGSWVAAGGDADWRGVFPGGGRHVELPTYAWQRQRYWIDAGTRGRISGRRGRWPLTGVLQELPSDDLHYVLQVGSAHQEYLRDHVVFGTIIVPGAFYISALLAAASERWPGDELDLEDISFQEALSLEPEQTVELHLILSPVAGEAWWSARVATRISPTSPWITHARGKVRPAQSGSRPSPLDDLLAQARSIDVNDVLQKLASVHINWGPAWRWMTRAWSTPTAAISELDAPGPAGPAQAPLHPVLLDNGFATIAAAPFAVSNSGVPKLPFAVSRLHWFRVPRGKVRCASRLRESNDQTSSAVSLDIAFWDEDDALVATIESFSLRAAPRALFLKQAPRSDITDAFYVVDWTRLDTPAQRPSPERHWIVAHASNSLSAEFVSESLGAAGLRVERVPFRGVREALARSSGSTSVLCLWDEGTEGAAAEAELVLAEALDVLRAIDIHARSVECHWLTYRAMTVIDAEDVRPAATSLWGLGRTFMIERPELRFKLIDSDRSVPDAPLLLRELTSLDDENQVAWRNGERYVARLTRAARGAVVPQSENYQLRAARPGALDSLEWAVVPRESVGPGEIEIEVWASGLNFRDVLNALGMYPGKSGPLGGECAGVVTAVGALVTDVQVGDRVMALVAGAFRRFVTVDVRLSSPVPQGWSFEQAATIPAAFLTAWYALNDLARLQRRERVLVHAAAGGVGMAAVQIARWIGAEVLATASPAKWDRVRALGVRHVASSRDLSFAESFRTSAGGADVVLNSLTGDFIDASLSLLSPGGRFVEMGKADLRDAAILAAKYPGVSYTAFDLAELDRGRIADMFTELRAGFESGDLRPLPLHSFELGAAEAAFRFMAQARHVGKIVVSAPERRLPVAASVLVSGGTGALGLEVARHCARRGVGHLILTSRRGIEAPGAAAAVQELNALGARVTLAAVDVADRAALARVLEDVPPEYPLRGIVHAAGIIDDGLLSEQTPERFARVLAPKVWGAWHLHELTRKLPLDFFITFSSIAGTLGSASQGGYAAANAFLDGLAAQRRALGLPALSLAWGPWAERGMAAGLDPKLQARFSRMGISLISPEQGLALLDSAMSRRQAALVLVPLDLRKASSTLGSPPPPLWRSLLRPEAKSGISAEWVRELSSLGAEQRLSTMTERVRSEIARVLSFPATMSVPLDRNFNELGLDSLTALELRSALSRHTGLALPASIALDHPTPAHLARALHGMMFRDQTREPEPASGVPRTVQSGVESTGRDAEHLQQAGRASVARASVSECLRHLNAPVLRLFCFHEAGGDGSVFVPFTALASAGVEVHAISLTRAVAHSADIGERYIGEVLADLQRFVDVPYAVMGHSLGALQALQVIQRAAREGLSQPVLFVPSAPPDSVVASALATDPDLAFAQVFGERARDRVTEHLRAAFAADVALWSTMPRESAPIDAPIAAFVGAADRVASQGSLSAWEARTRGDFSLTVVPGDHFYLHHEESRELVLREVRRHLERVLAERTHPPQAQRRRAIVQIW